MKSTVASLVLCALAVSCASSPPPKPTTASFSFQEVESRATAPVLSPTFVTADDGTRLAIYPYLAEHPRATLVFVHGGGAYSGAGYPSLAAGLAKNWGVSTYLFDLRGHGNSEGPRGDSPSVEQVYRDFARVIGEVQKENGALPLFVGGHSSGAGFVLNYASWKPDNRVRGYVFLSPYLGYKSGTDKVASSDEKAAPRFSQVDVAAFVLNSMSFGLFGGHTHAVWFNYPDAVLKSQPLLISSITVNMSLAMTPANPVAQFKTLDHPFALFIGADDEVIDPQKVLAYAELPSAEIRSTSQAQMVDNATHLSILLSADALAGQAVETMLR